MVFICHLHPVDVHTDGTKALAGDVQEPGADQNGDTKGAVVPASLTQAPVGWRASLTAASLEKAGSHDFHLSLTVGSCPVGVGGS